MHKLILILFLFSFSLVFGQIDKVYSPEQLKSDFDLMVESFLNVHPAPYEFISKDSLDAVRSELRSQLNHEMNELEFQVIVRKYIKEVGCGHTMARPSQTWYTAQKKDSKILPVRHYLVGDELYVKQAFKGDSILKPGTRIYTINDVAVPEILEKMRAIHERDGYTESFVNAKIQRSFTTLYLFLYGNFDEYHLSYATENGKIALLTVESGYPKDLKVDKAPTPSYIHKMSNASFYVDTLHPKTAVIDINSFERKGFKKFYKSVFATMDEKNIENLVIDVRGNGGGYFPHGNRLLTYLMPGEFNMKFSRPKIKVKKNKNLNMDFSSKMTKLILKTMPDSDKEDPHRNYSIPYKRDKKHPFDGNVYVLTDGYSFSMGGLIPAILQNKTEATIVGQETGGGENGSYAILKYFLTLPATEVRVILPHYFLDHDVTPKVKGKGVIPDYTVPRTIETILSKEDEYMLKVFELINKK